MEIAVEIHLRPGEGVTLEARDSTTGSRCDVHVGRGHMASGKGRSRSGHVEMFCTLAPLGGA